MQDNNLSFLITLGLKPSKPVSLYKYLLSFEGTIINNVLDNCFLDRNDCRVE